MRKKGAYAIESHTSKRGTVEISGSHVPEDRADVLAGLRVQRALHGRERLVVRIRVVPSPPAVGDKRDRAASGGPIDLVRLKAAQRVGS